MGGDPENGKGSRGGRGQGEVQATEPRRTHLVEESGHRDRPNEGAGSHPTRMGQEWDYGTENSR